MDEIRTNEQSSNFIEDIINADLAEGKHTKIITRFPPEPNGYLHIGHAKAICINFGMKQKYGGECNLRFDDTNPVKEDVEYMESIKEDIRWLGFEWDRELNASDYFEQMYDFAVKLIKDGKAYVCDLTADQIRETRGTLTEPGKESPYRNRSVEGNLDLCLLRSPKYPDWNADQGRQVFTYAYLPHVGALAESNVWSEAAQLNRAPLQFAGRRLTAEVPFSVLGGSVSLEVVKKAEKSDDLVIRLVETAGSASRTRLCTTLKEARLIETNLIEWEELGSFEFRNGEVELDFRPFDIRTFKVRRKR